VEVWTAVVGIGLAAYLAKTSSTNFSVSARYQRLVTTQLAGLDGSYVRSGSRVDALASEHESLHLGHRTSGLLERIQPEHLGRRLSWEERAISQMPSFLSSLLSPHIFSILSITHFFTSWVCSFGNFILACAGALAVLSKLVEELNDEAKSRSVLAETFEKFRERSLQNKCSRTK
jgi:hypothetical protein